MSLNTIRISTVNSFLFGLYTLQISNASSTPSLNECSYRQSLKTLTCKGKEGDKSGTTKVIHFLRHAEGLHNVAGKQNYLNYMKSEFVDSVLSQNGEKQCLDLCKKHQESNIFSSEVSLVVVSPLRRTLQTATLVFPSLIGKIPWIAVEHVREQTGLHPCDRRLPRTTNAMSFQHVGFENIAHENDPLYDLYTFQREPDFSVAERGRQFLYWLKSRDEDDIVVVSHSAFLLNFFNHVVDSDDEDKRSFENCEMRSYRVVMPCEEDSSFSTGEKLMLDEE